MQDNSHDTRLRQFAKSNSGTFFFIIIAAAIFGALYIAYERFILDTYRYYLYLDYVGELASRFLFWIGIDHQYVVSVTNIEKPTLAEMFRSVLKIDDLGVRVKISQGADGFAIYSLILACIMAWPGNFIKKLLAVAVGITVVFVANILRVAGAVLVDIHAPLQFQTFQELIFPLALAGIALLYFFAWIRLSNTHPND